MSGLRENLEEWAQSHGAQVASAVADQEPTTRERIRSRRRNRAVATAATAVVAVVGVVAIASALPGVGQAPPAQELSRHLSELVCGEPWVVESGTTEYISDAGYYFDEPQGDWVLTDSSGNTHANFAGYSAGQAAVSWQGNIGLRGHTIVRARTVAVKLGTIVGVTEEQYAPLSEGGGANLHVNAPRPGACGDNSPGNSSGKVTYHLVLQFSRVGDGGGPVATIVDPGGPLTVTVDGVEEYVKAQAAPPADPHGPTGDVFQAFLVPRPTEASCRPYQDLMGAGLPNGRSMTYTASFPGLRPLGGLLEEGNLVIDADSPQTRRWYADHDAWLVVASGGPKIAEPLGWNADATQLAWSDDAPPPDAQLDCVITFEYSPPKGAVYLVIDGIDLDAVNAAYPDVSIDFVAAAMQTWVYLGIAS